MSTVMTAERAVDLVRSGDRVWVHTGCATPEPLLEALVRRSDALREVEIVHMVACGDAAYARPEYAGRFRLNSLFLSGCVRGAVAEGRADYTPISLSDIENFLESGEFPVDVAMVQTSPPDAHGFLSLGISVDCTLTACRLARRVIAEVNDRMPRTMGQTFLHMSQVAAMVETSRPLHEMRPEPSTLVQERVAANVASLIPDGATLQVGIGGIPNAVLARLHGRRDLGIHSEMCSDGIIGLMESGAVTGTRKTLHPGKVVTGFLLGSQELFEFVRDHPAFEFYPTRYVNDPYLIGRHDNMIAVNSALQVDLTGQICSDSIGTRPYSGFGGQLDFMRGAARSKGGKPVIALPSTARNGTVSRIVPVLDPGAGVVTTRSDVHYVVTEHGIAYLRGKTLRQRAEALMAIADPKFRDGLREFAERTWHVAARELVA
ncbi:MAG TPA: acetyl-CoA hydrolase/transferase C-terminal domain-containing protein [Candidatus Sulfopaludibacter sp.]|nr:acetyl-CoA hydrolase/transferase C-terminal domain-containing protein [Candidatus Sulfopaludibacter sp.]